MIRKLTVLLITLLVCTAASAAQTLLVFGDSLSAGYGLDIGQGWVALLQRRLAAADSPWQVVNASVSGETSAGGLARLPAVLKDDRPALVLIELGANDGLRGQSLPAMRTNLEAMVDAVRAAHAQPVLFEMRVPANYGPVYDRRFTQTFDDVAAEKKLPLVPFFLAAIAVDRDRWFQDDGLHPTAAAQPQLLDAVWPTLAPLLRTGSQKHASVAAAQP